MALKLCRLVNPKNFMAVKARRKKVKSATAKKRSDSGRWLRSLLKRAKEKKFSLAYSPMLATLSGLPEEEEGWLFEVKWDGYRASLS